MNKIVSTLAVAALAASVSAGAALAQDVNAGAKGTVDVGAGVNAGSGDNGVNAQVGAGASSDTTVAANAMGPENYGQVISSLQSKAATADDIKALGQDVTVDIVLLSELKGNAADNANALDQAISDQADAMADIHAALDANAAIKAKLDEAGYTADEVVAVTSTADNEVTLVVDDSATQN